MNIRRATLEDLPHILEVFIESISKNCYREYTQEQLDVWAKSSLNEKRWHKAISEDCFVVYFFENKIAGFASLRKEQEIDFLYVHPDFIRKGIATDLLHYLKVESEKHQVKSLVTNASKTALPFFESNGFVVVETLQHNIEGILIENYLMREM